MPLKDPTEIVNVLRSRIERAGPRKGLIGAQAGICIREVDRDFNPRDYGVRNVSEFLKQHASDIRVISMSGPDLVYGLSEWTESQLEELDDQNFDPWRAWVSPASHLSIGITTDGRIVRPIREGTRKGKDVVVAPAPEQVHRQLAREFLTGLDNPSAELATTLEQALDGSSPRWWRGWIEALRTRGEKSLYSRWLEHRRRGLEKALEMRLAEKGLDADAVTRAMTTVRAQRKKPPAAKGPKQQSEHSQSATPANLRDLVLRIVPDLSEGQLRELRLPLGAVLDALDINLPDQ